VDTPDSSPAVGREQDFAAQCARILATPPGDGVFREEHVLPTGERVTHGVPFAIGLASLHFAGRYRVRFGPVPAWVEPLHPYHRRLLCELALTTGVALPEQPPPS